LVNDAGDAKVAELEAVLSSQNAIDAIAARDDAEIAKDIAESSAVLASGYAGSAQAYATTALQAKNSAQVHAQVAVDAAASIPLIVGPVGPQGQQGIQGIPGVAGQQGIQGPAGQQGIQGIQGIQGVAGSNGQDGAVGQQGPAGNAWVYRGEYDGGITYAPNDYVSFQGSSYVMINFIGAAGYDPIGYPGSWQIVAQKGDQGEPGPQGPGGSDGASFNFSGTWVMNNTYAPGTIVIDPSDSNAYISIRDVYGSYTQPSGDSYNWRQYSYQGPQGDQGAPGEPGPEGQQGSNGSDGQQGPAGPSIAEWVTETNYNVGAIVTYQTGAFICIQYVDEMYWTQDPPSSPSHWSPLGASSFVRLSGETSQTIVGKITTMPLGGNAGLNIGVGGVSTTATTPGDFWIVSGGTNLNYRDATGAWRIVAGVNLQNVFSNNQSIDCTTVNPALRVTQKGTGNSLLVEDSSTPDVSALVVDASGNVGIGVTTGFVAASKLDVVGNTRSTTISTGAGPTFSVNSTTSHTGGSDSLDLLVTINGVNYRIGLRPA
jgi:hypothetical protein